MHDMREGIKTNGWLRTIIEIGLFSFFFNVFVLDYLTRKKFAVIPDLTSPESIAWSQPLPPEQWAKRSPELEAAVVEREKDLEAAATGKLASSEAA